MGSMQDHGLLPNEAGDREHRRMHQRWSASGELILLRALQRIADEQVVGVMFAEDDLISAHARRAIRRYYRVVDPDRVR